MKNTYNILMSSDRDKIIAAYHCLENGNNQECINMLSMVGLDYYISELHKDISRALLCYLTLATTMDDDLYKESEFYLVIYRLVKYVTLNNLKFSNSIHFYDLKNELFKDLM